MDTQEKIQGIDLVLAEQETDLLMAIEAFLVDKRSQNISSGTMSFYKKKLKGFVEYCEARAIKRVTQITPNDIRQFMFYLEDKGHNPGGCHAFYRTIKTFLNWWEMEIEDDSWKNPIKKTKPPKLSIEPLDPLRIEVAQAMLKTCKKGSFYGDRDTCIILMLMDTGLRASELLSINVDDINLLIGSILVTNTKGRKFRTVFFGKRTRRALRAWLRHRIIKGPLFCQSNGQRLDYSGLRQIICRRSIKAHVPIPSIHSFRRFFALEMLRNGADIMSLQTLMGHSDLQVLRRYIKQNNIDIQRAHAHAGPVDNIE